MRLIEIARQRLADRTSFVPNRNAILAGDWDSGRLVQEELKRLEAEYPKGHEGDGE